MRIAPLTLLALLAELHPGVSRTAAARAGVELCNSSPCTWGVVTQKTTSAGLPGADLSFSTLGVDGSVSPVIQTMGNDLGQYALPNTDQADVLEEGLFRVDIDAAGYESRRYYRTHLYESCELGECREQSFNLVTEGTEHNLLPDMVVGPAVTSDWYITNRCPELAGNRNVCMRVSVGTANVGEGDFRVTAPLDQMDVVSQILDHSDGSERRVRIEGEFLHHPGHDHIHLDEWTHLRLRKIESHCDTDATAKKCPVAAANEKVSFCLVDTDLFDETLAASPFPALSCGTQQGPDGEPEVIQGVSSGWMDVYTENLEGQLIDLAGLSSGEYWLEVEVNPNGTVIEENYNNNISRRRIQLDMPVCGDGKRHKSERCDGKRLGGKTCESLTGTPGGELSCTDTCEFDVSDCVGQMCPTDNLGDLVLHDLIVGSNIGQRDELQPKTCAIGSSGGREATYRWRAPNNGYFTFHTDKSEYDTVLYILKKGCEGKEIACDDDSADDPLTSKATVRLKKGKKITVVVDAYSAGDIGEHTLHVHQEDPVCGNDLLEPTETCDSEDFGGATCYSLGFARGELSCDDSCQFDVSNCVMPVCGNGIAEPLSGPLPQGEQCDGDDLLGKTCADLDDFIGGQLGCDSMCRLDTSGCHGPAPEWVLGSNYAVGDDVTYEGLVYRCIVAHTAQSLDLVPPSSPGLWSPL